jgi:hypothetical protein
MLNKTAARFSGLFLKEALAIVLKRIQQKHAEAR